MKKASAFLLVILGGVLTTVFSSYVMPLFGNPDGQLQEIASINREIANKLEDIRKSTDAVNAEIKSSGEQTPNEKALFDIIDRLMITNSQTMNNSTEAVELAKHFKKGDAYAEGSRKYCNEIGYNVDIGKNHNAGVTADNDADGLSVTLSINGHKYRGVDPDFTKTFDINGENLKITYSGKFGDRYCFKSVVME